MIKLWFEVLIAIIGMVFAYIPFAVIGFVIKEYYGDIASMIAQLLIIVTMLTVMIHRSSK